MSNVRINPQVQHGRQLLDALSKAAGSPEQKNGLLAGRKQGEVTTLFVRSRLVDGLMKLFMPERRAMEKQLAHAALSEAFSDSFPGIAAHELMPMIGIRPNANIRVELLSGYARAVDKVIVAKAREDASVALREGKINLQQWRISATPGLKALDQLGNADKQALQAHIKPALASGLAAFRDFACQSAGLAAAPATPDPAAARKVVEFLSAWPNLPAADKAALHVALSPNGQQALGAIDALVPKAIEALQLPVSGGVSFGLSDALAGDARCQSAFRQLAAALVLPNDGARTRGLTAAADEVGQMLALAMKANVADPASVITQPVRLKNALRAFMDHHMNPMAGSRTTRGQNQAIAKWLMNKDAFLERACNAAMRSLLFEPQTRQADGAIGIGGHSYLPGKLLGRGAEGIVNEARLGSATGLQVAIKSTNLIEVGGIAPTATPREAAMHARVAARGSPHLLGFYGAGNTSEGGISIAMEFAPHGSLQDVIGVLSARQVKADKGEGAAPASRLPLARHALRAMASGLRDLHEAGILHRDMKGGNVFIGADGELKIGDFGKSVLTSENMTVDRPADSPQWLPPEFGRQKGYTEFTPGADLWSAAIVVLELATGKPSPFEHERPVDAFKALDDYYNDARMLDPASRRSKLGLDELHRSDPDLANLLVDMLHPLPDQRPAATGVLARLPTDSGRPDMGSLLIDLAKPEN